LVSHIPTKRFLVAPGIYLLIDSLLKFGKSRRQDYYVASEPKETY